MQAVPGITVEADSKAAQVYELLADRNCYVCVLAVLFRR